MKLATTIFALILLAQPVTAQDVFIVDETVTVVEPPVKLRWQLTTKHINGVGVQVPEICGGDHCVVMPKPLYDEWLAWTLKLRTS